MMNLKPTERPDHSEWRRLLAEIEDLVQDRNDLLRIIEAAIPHEHEQQARVEQLAAELEGLELEKGGLRQQVIELEAELRLAHALHSLGQRRAVSRALDEALNTGDGVYRP